METKRIIISIFLMAIITYLCRVITMLLFREGFKNKFINSFLYYVPYSILAIMVFPKIIFSAGSVISGIVGTLVAIAVSFIRPSLLLVALSGVGAALVTNLLM